MQQRIIVGMVDGFGWDYWEQSEMPNLRRMVKENGQVTRGSAVFPTLTNVNNISIACGAWPEHHGVAANSYYDAASNTSQYIEDSSFLTCKPLFSKAKAKGIASALLTCKMKTLGIVGQDCALGLAAENLSGNLLKRFPKPPSMYSAEINYWLWEAAVDILDKNKEIGFVYVHTTDYPMHKWRPDEQESLTHLKRLDELLGEAIRTAPDAAMLITADHGMNPKKYCLDLARICAAKGSPVKFAISPVADRLLAHHAGHGGVSYIHLQDPDNPMAVLDVLNSLDGVEEVLDKKTAAKRFRLPVDRIGDLVVLASSNCVFGALEGVEREQLAPGYRNHGSMYESDVPIITYNVKDKERASREMKYNHELTDGLF